MVLTEVINMLLTCLLLNVYQLNLAKISCYKYTCDEVISVTDILILQMLKDNMHYLSKPNNINKMFTIRIYVDTNLILGWGRGGECTAVFEIGIIGLTSPTSKLSNFTNSFKKKST